MIETRRRKNQNSKFGRIRGQILNFDFCKETTTTATRRLRPDATTATIETRRRKIQNLKFGRIRGKILDFEFCKESSSSARRDDGDDATV